MKKLIIDIDGTETLVDFTADEIKAKEKEIQFLAAKAAQTEAEAEAKAEAKAALLERLGITEAEAKLLLA